MRLGLLLEEGEVHAAIGAMFHEAGVGREILRLSVLQHKEALGTQKIVGEDYVRQLLQLLQHIRRVGKNKVELLATAFQEAKHIGSQRFGCLVVQLIDKGADETVVQGVFLHRDHPSATAAQQFERDAPGTRKEVERHGLLFKVEIATQYIEKVLLGKVGGRPCLEGAWHIEVTTLVFPSDYAHSVGG